MVDKNSDVDARVRAFYGPNYDPRRDGGQPASEGQYNLLTSALTSQRFDSGNIGADQIVIRPRAPLRKCPEACPAVFDPTITDADSEKALIDGLASCL